MFAIFRKRASKLLAELAALRKKEESLAQRAKAHIEEKARLQTQCEEIINRLRSGLVTNTELARIALKYTSRISDLRALGHEIKCVKRDRSTGLTWYQLLNESPTQPGRSAQECPVY